MDGGMVPFRRLLERSRRFSIYISLLISKGIDPRDPRLRRQIWSYLVNQQDEIRRAYIRASPYQPVRSKNPQSGDHGRSFQTFTVYGFRTWGKVRGKKCAFLNHDLMNQSQHIQHVFYKYTTQDVADNRLRLKFLIRASRYLALQGSAFREILYIYSMKVRKTIREEIGDLKKEQMTIVLRFVDKDRIVRKRFFGLVHVFETSAQTLKKERYFVLYDGVSNMQGEWNGLHALILKDCPCAYYIHLVIHVHQFFTKLISVVNIVGVSCKRNDELKHAKANEMKLHICLLLMNILINMFSATCEVLINFVEDRVTYASRADADAAYKAITSFKFVFVLHFMKNIMAVTNLLSQNVISFCKAHNIDIPDMNAQDNFTMEQHYRVNIFYAAIDSQLQELNIRFNDSSVELLMLSSVLDPREGYNFFRIDEICQLVDKFYRDDFTDNEKIYMRRDIAKKISMESVIDDFRDMKERKVRF
ncbi:TTF-type domain-containing protein [Citrus sinensis]|nr:TTF-type domain-containing protein [Citrus sinensis]